MTQREIFDRIMDGSLARAEAIEKIRSVTLDFTPIMCDALMSDFEEYLISWKRVNKEYIDIVLNGGLDENAIVPNVYFDVVELLRKYITPSNAEFVESHRDDTSTIPCELDTDKARAIFTKARDLGLMDNDNKWLKSLQLLACFAHDMSMKLGLGKGINNNGSPRISWKPFERFFNIENGKLRSNYNDIQKTGQNPSEIHLLDSIF